MNLYTQFVGGIGDIILAMMKPGGALGYFPALKARGDTTMIEAHANTDVASDLFEGLAHVDYLRFRGYSKVIDTTKSQGFERLKRWDGLPWQRPEIILDAEEQRLFDEIACEPYVAVHLSASLPTKAPQHPEELLAALRAAGIRVVVLGVEATDDGPAVTGNRLSGYRRLLTDSELLIPLPKLRLHVALAQHATKFIGALSCFNCAAHMVGVPAFVLTNRSIKDPSIERWMDHNCSIVQPWNVGKPIEQIYRDAVEWAKL